MKKEETTEETPITELHRYRVEIVGITPVIWNRPLTDFRKAHIAPKVKKDPAQEEWNIWRDKTHVRGEDEEVYWPSENVHEAIVGGAKYWGAKLANKSIYTFCQRGMICEPMTIKDHDGNKVTKQSKSLLPFEKEVRTGMKSTVVYTVRPMLPPEWKGIVFLNVWDPRLSKDLMLTVLRFTGQYNGIGDFRKYYGRFNVVAIDEENV